MESESYGWRPHLMRQGDGKGGWLCKQAECQFLAMKTEEKVQPLAMGGGAGSAMGFGLAQMDNGEVAFAGAWNADGTPSTIPVIAISADRGDTWSNLVPVPGAKERPMNLSCLGAGGLTFVADRRYFSRDYGRTWTSIEHPPTQSGMPFNMEGNAWVDRDKSGKATAILEIGWHYEPGKRHPLDDANAVFRRSVDGGRTWIDELMPPQWKLQINQDGKTYIRGASEGAIVRAANGWLVAALRPDMHPRYFGQPAVDHYEGTAVSISKDDGRTWSPLNMLYDAGRMHANLLRLPNDDLLLTLVVRHDIQDGRLASYRRGCDAIVSHDNGQTWDLDRQTIVDEWEFFDHDNPHIGPAGHIYSVVLDDGSILTTHNNYLTRVISLVRWRV